MGRSLTGGAVMLACLLLIGGSAHAATARVKSDCDKGGCVDSVIVTAAPGEVNRLTIRTDAGGAVVVSDEAVGVQAGVGCEPRDAGAVVCRGQAGALRIVGVLAGDGDDRVEIATAVLAFVDGGPGADELRAGSTGATLRGGPGADRLFGGPGADVLEDGDAGPVADTFDGGPGVDVVSYESRETAVDVDLTRPATAGSPGEGDVLSGVEGAIGGKGDDRLAGSPGPDRLTGGPGNDHLAGREGDDRLDAVSGADRMDGGDGDDDISAAEPQGRQRGSRVTIACGAGGDDVDAVGLNDFVAPDCERISLGGSLATEVRLRTPLGTLRGVVMTAFRPSHRRFELRAVRGGRVLGAVTASGSRRTLLRLSAEGRRALRARRSVRVRLFAEPSRADSRALRSGFTTLLRAP